MLEMNFYCTREADGTIHVQNAVMGTMGQHHVHTAEDFERWKADIELGSIQWLTHEGLGPCECGLRAGETRGGVAW